jgi:PAS domain S-box-containing protein
MRSVSEESLRLIVETIPGLIAVMTPAGEVEHVNRQVLEYFGRTLDELKRWGTSDAVHPADLPQVRAAWQQAIDTGQPYEFEHRLRRRDGEYRWFQSRGLPLRNADGQIVRWYNLLTDIHARKDTEEKLRRSEAELLEAQRLSHAGSWRHELESGSFTVSPEVLRIRGVESADPLSTIDRMYSGITLPTGRGSRTPTRPRSGERASSTRSTASCLVTARSSTCTRSATRY